MVLKQLFKLFKLLNSARGSNQIAAGVALGVIVGLAPVLSPQALFVFICLFFFRIQLGSAFISSFLVKFIAYFFDPLFHLVGSRILEIDFMVPLYTYLYNLPLLPLTRFYNTIVMGAGVV
ncbi:MAG: TIGR03546 family protein, partial [bacterium]